MATGSSSPASGISGIRITVVKTWIEAPNGNAPVSWLQLAIAYKGDSAASGIPIEGDLATLKVGDQFKLVKA